MQIWNRAENGRFCLTTGQLFDPVSSPILWLYWSFIGIVWTLKGLNCWFGKTNYHKSTKRVIFWTTKLSEGEKSANGQLLCPKNAHLWEICYNGHNYYFSYIPAVIATHFCAKIICRDWPTLIFTQWHTPFKGQLHDPSPDPLIYKSLPLYWFEGKTRTS